jgi:hypothetical protein
LEQANNDPSLIMPQGKYDLALAAVSELPALARLVLPAA